MNWYKQSKILQFPEGNIAEEILEKIAQFIRTRSPQERKDLFTQKYNGTLLQEYKFINPYSKQETHLSIIITPLPNEVQAQVKIFSAENNNLLVDLGKSTWMIYALSPTLKQYKNMLLTTIEHEIAHIIDPKELHNIIPYPDWTNNPNNPNQSYKSEEELYREYLSHPSERDAFESSIIREISRKFQANEFNIEKISNFNYLLEILSSSNSLSQEQAYMKYLSYNPKAKQRFMKRLYQELSTINPEPNQI